MYVCMYVCVYVCVYIYTFKNFTSTYSHRNSSIVNFEISS